jgi:tetratricopeptide (TPR) repeat protein
MLLLAFATQAEAQKSTNKKNAEEGDKNQTYDTAVARGNMAIGEKNYRLAIAQFKEALKQKPSDSYARYQLRFAEGLFEKDSLDMVDKQRKSSAQTREKERISRFNRGMTAYTNYENAAQLGNFEDQLLYLKQFLNTIPDSSELNEYQANFTGKLEFAKKKLKTIRDYLSRTKGSSYQAEAIPYTDMELRTRYPNINFTPIPIGQSMEPLDSASRSGISKISKEVLTRTGDLKLSDSSDNIKLTCESISSKDNNVYLKLRLKNNDTTDFITGPMQLNVIKKDKSVKALRPLYVSNFPIVLPKKEFVIVYATKTYQIDKGDQLAFELQDLEKNKKLKITIPPASFSNETKRQF